jgi:hypothetical protein
MHNVDRAPSDARVRAARRGIAGLLVGLAALTTAAAAIAAHPKKGSHFAGTDSAAPINGFKAPVTFTVSPNGKTLSRFAYATLGCFGAGGYQPGVDYYTQPSAIIKVGTVKVSGSGRLSVSGHVFVYSSHGVKTTTTTKVSGSFTKSTAASGSITFSQKDTGAYRSSCGPATLRFTAKAR